MLHVCGIIPAQGKRKGDTMIWHERGGNGSRTVLLLHGLGATGAVWQGVCAAIERRAAGRWIVADLPGHGASSWQDSYSVGEMAAALAPLVRAEARLYVVGHSLGTYVGLALASGWFGVRVSGVLGVDPKVSWSETDVRAAHELATRPVRWFAQREDALARYRRTSGLDEGIAPGEQLLARGIGQRAEGWRVTQDPHTFFVAGASFATLMASAACPVMLARGERDPMVTTDELRSYREDAAVIEDAGHNAQAERPGAVLALLERLTPHA